jgi:hypothetical protein
VYGVPSGSSAKTRGGGVNIRHYLISLVFIFMPMSLVAEQQQLLEAITRQLHITETVAGRFEQKKSIKVLPRPLYSKGYFNIVKARGLEWKITEPIETELVFNFQGGVQGPSVSMMGGGEQPAFKMIGQILQAVLTTDWQLLERYFSITGQLQGQDWVLELLPSTESIKTVLTRVELAGDRHLERVVLFESNGDRTEIFFFINED